VLVVGHSYNLYDEHIGQPILRELERQGCEVVDSDSVDHVLAGRLGRKMSPKLYWPNGRQLLGAAEWWREKVDGIVFIVTFPCGPDSLVTEFALRKIKGVPVMMLVIDEHSGEVGLQTRLESFVDILRMQRDAARSLRSAGESMISGLGPFPGADATTEPDEAVA
jgi:predicted nucleotide-binding protein (sugar kinase/HSP70/actin superfamily)